MERSPPPSASSAWGTRSRFSCTTAARLRSTEKLESRRTAWTSSCLVSTQAPGPVWPGMGMENTGLVVRSIR
jgi:hypothetical protein